MYITTARHDNLLSAINELQEIVRENVHNAAVSGFKADRPTTGGKGRPKVNITRAQLILFYQEGYTATEMANHFKCSKSVVYKRCYEENIKFRERYTIISDEDLTAKMINIHEKYPNSGSVMMSAYLNSEGVHVQRSRVRAILSLIDPFGTSVRWGSTVQRRSYSVPTPNALWHMDAHLKLVRWGFATHGCIDGYSRMIPYLKCTTSMTANTVMDLCIPAVMKHGIPSRVRCSHITGRSVHNQRIERLWRDVYYQVISKYYEEFMDLERNDQLNPDNLVHKFPLQYFYLDAINNSLSTFVTAWNCHRIRTERMRSPRKIWLDGLLQNINSGHTVTNEIFHIVTVRFC